MPVASPLLLKATAIAAVDEEIKRHSINPNGVRHSRSLGDLVGLVNSGVSGHARVPASLRMRQRVILRASIGLGALHHPISVTKRARAYQAERMRDRRLQYPWALHLVH